MGQFSTHIGPLTKPSRLVRKVEKFARVITRRAAKDAEDAKLDREAAKIRAQVWDRDKAVCRAYGVPLKRQHENPEIVGHCHHIRFKSQGGPDETWNEILLSPMAHERAHARYDAIVLEVHGDADETLTFIEKQIETGQELRRWESRVPR